MGDRGGRSRYYVQGGGDRVRVWVDGMYGG